MSGNDGFGEVAFSENFADINGDGSVIASGLAVLNGLAGDPFTASFGSSRAYDFADLIAGQGAFFYDSTVSLGPTRPRI